jgi:penicillin G amidase
VKTVLWRLAAALELTLTVACSAGTQDYGKVELLRDHWGIPHVFSDTDLGAMYGLGCAAAQERGFQMTHGLRVMQGRLAEIIGARQKGGRKETALDEDRKMRTFGWARAAVRIASNLDTDTRGLLEACCEGVNDSFAAQQKAGTLHPLFRKLGVKPEKWSPADCLLSWWHVAQFFAGDGTRDLLVWHNRTQPQLGQPQPPRPSARWMDDAAAVVQREDVSNGWLREVEQFCASRDMDAVAPGATNETPKFSHAWVVGGRKTTTGSAVLVSDPQTPVRNPSLWMEFHVKGKSFDARGIGMCGSRCTTPTQRKRFAPLATAIGRTAATAPAPWMCGPAQSCIRRH